MLCNEWASQVNKQDSSTHGKDDYLHKSLLNHMGRSILDMAWKNFKIVVCDKLLKGVNNYLNKY